MTRKQKAIEILESAAVHIYRHVGIDESNGLVLDTSSDDWAAWSLLLTLRNSLRA